MDETPASDNLQQEALAVNGGEELASQPELSAAEETAAPGVPEEPVPVAAIEERVNVDPLARLRHLPVQVSVRLAETRIPMSQLMNITPGMLIPFNKSCDDLLDLYVNNARYCRGEAVKIGEKFGLKIDEVGVQPEIEHKVIQV